MSKHTSLGFLTHHARCAALALAITVPACAAPDAESGDSSEDAITHEQAADQLNLKENVLRDQPATSEAGKLLGIKNWNVYSGASVNFTGMVAFATDENADVSYALVVDGTGERHAVVKYDKDGIDKGATITPAVYDALLVEFGALVKKLNADLASSGGLAAQDLSNKSKCGLRIAAVALGAVVAGGAAWLLGATGVVLTAGYGVVEAGWVWAGLAATSPVALAGGASAIALGATVVTQKGRAAWKDTVTVCKAAANGK